MKNLLPIFGLLFVFISSYSYADELYEVKFANYEVDRTNKQLISYPTNIAELTPRPLVIISHGNGHRFDQYTYLQQHLSERGFITMSHYNNTRPGIETSSTTTLKHTDYFLGNIKDIAEGVLLGKVQKDNIAWIGHSRGGEGVVRAHVRLLNKDFTPEHYQASSIKLISSIAPTTFLDSNKVNPGTVPYHMFVGGADGDVSGAPRRIVMSMPIFERASGEKFLTYVQGAGHNVFNDKSRDEGVGPNRLKRHEVLHISKTIYAELLNIYLNKNTDNKFYFKNNWEKLRLPGIDAKYKISNEYKDKVDSVENLIVADFQPERSESQFRLPYQLHSTVLAKHEGKMQDANSSFKYREESDPMNGMTRWIDAKNAPQGLAFSWDKEDAALTYNLGDEGVNIADYGALSFRAAQMTNHPLTEKADSAIHFSLELKDTDGNISLISMEEFGLIPQPHDRYENQGWANEFSIVRIPLEAFTNQSQNLNLETISSIRFLFGENYGSPEGRITIDDIQINKN